MAQMPSLSSTDPSEWQYVAEGGANVVLSHQSRARAPAESGLSTPFDGLLIRVRKRKLARNNIQTGSEEPAVYDKVDSSEFGKHVIEPLLARAARLKPECEDSLCVVQDQVDVYPDWLRALNQSLNDSGQRPPERLGQDEVDDRCTQVVICEDLIGGSNVVSVEIKPKWGFVPSAQHLPDSDRDIKTKYCRFCMHRYMKEAHKHPMQALERHQSGYCPLDLYSGDEARVNKAVKALWSGWEASHGSANNLRIFVDGKRVEPHDDPGLARLRTLLLQSKTHEAPASTLDLFASQLTHALITSPALSALKDLQSSLDPFDIQGLATVPSLNLEGGALPENLSGQPSLDEWKSWLDRRFLQTESPSMETVRSESDALRSALLSYLMSATFKDCSMIVRFQYRDPASLSPQHALTSPPSPSSTSPPESRLTRIAQQPRVTVKLIDLDPKPMSKVPHYYKLDKDILDTWRTMLTGLPDQCRVRECA
ncbi:hypothetical protein OIV83_001915 [Microbotryomycetes sp. JL201]|nr:hypothetical protein OIV83_001915 [Microbotryomycetes sp. JL201]